MSVRTLLSRSDGTDVVADLATWRPSETSEGLLWIDVQEPTEDERALLTSSLSLDDTTLEALRDDEAAPDAHVLDDGMLVTVRALGEDLTKSPIVLHILIGQEWALTWHAEPIGFLDEHHKRIQDRREVGRLSPVLLVVAMLDWHLDTFYAAAETLEHEIDKLDDAALRGDDKGLLARLVQMRRRTSSLRRLLSSHRDMYSEVGRPDFLPDIEPREAEALAVLTHRLERATEAVANAREMLIGTFDVHMTRTAQRTNDIMRLLTLVSVTLLPAAVLAGVMGMNFQVRLFDNSSLFWVVVAAMVVFMLATVIVAKKRRWV